MAGKTKIRDRTFRKPTSRMSAYYVAFSALGVAAIAMASYKGGRNMWGLDDECTRDDIWKQVGLRPPCDPDSVRGVHEYDPAKATSDTVFGPDGTPDWFTAENLFYAAVILTALGIGVARAMRRRGEAVVAA